MGSYLSKMRSTSWKEQVGGWLVGWRSLEYRWNIDGYLSNFAHFAKREMRMECFLFIGSNRMNVIVLAILMNGQVIAGGITTRCDK